MPRCVNRRHLDYFPDYHLKRRLEFKASYDVVCSLLSSGLVNSTLSSVVESRFADVRGICRDSKATANHIFSVKCALGQTGHLLTNSQLQKQGLSVICQNYRTISTRPAEPTVCECDVGQAWHTANLTSMQFSQIICMPWELLFWLEARDLWFFPDTTVNTHNYPSTFDSSLKATLAYGFWIS